MSCAVGHRHGSDATFLWLWLWLAAVALIRRLAWELPHAVGAALKKAKKKKKNPTNKVKISIPWSSCCGARVPVAYLQPWDTGSIPSGIVG